MDTRHHRSRSQRDKALCNASKRSIRIGCHQPVSAVSMTLGGERFQIAGRYDDRSRIGVDSLIEVQRIGKKGELIGAGLIQRRDRLDDQACVTLDGRAERRGKFTKRKRHGNNLISPIAKPRSAP